MKQIANLICSTLILLATSQLAEAKTNDPSVIKDKQFVHGKLFLIGKSGQQEVWMNAYQQSQEIIATLFFINKTSASINLDPSKIEAIAYNTTKTKKPEAPLKVYGAAEYEKKIRSSNTWSAILYGVSTGIANTPTYTTTSYSGYSSNGGYAYGSATASPSSTDYAVSNEITRRQINDFTSQLAQNYKEISQSLLKQHTLTPKSSYGGVVHIKKTAAQSYALVVPYGGKKYHFKFKLNKQKLMEEVKE